MNTNDLPLAQKLAALMEAGRAAHPNMKHVSRTWGDGQHYGCAMTFAAAGAGVAGTPGTGRFVEDLAAALGTTVAELTPYLDRVVDMNDTDRAPLGEIIAAVREDRLPEKRPRGIPQMWLDEYATFPSYIWIAPKDGLVQYTVTGVDFGKEWKLIEPPKVQKIAAPSKKLRVSAKTGKSWPVAKGCYA